MSLLQAPKKLRIEDFKSDQQDLVGKIAFVYNTFVDSVYSVLNGNVDFSNLNRSVNTIIVTFDSTGKLIGSPQVKTNLSTKIRGLNVIEALNNNSATTYPVSAPFVSWITNGSILTITSVSGLQASSSYTLTIEVIG